MSSQVGTAPKVLAVLQAGGQGSRMDVLTRERAKPMLPFAGVHALIDFALSAVAHANISDVWVSVQYQASSLDGHLAGGRPWDLDRTHGGYRRMVPEVGTGAAYQEGFSTGNADGLYRIRDAIAEHAPDLVLVLSCDQVYDLDLQAVIAAHLEHEAECTIVTSEVGQREASHKLVVATEADAAQQSGEIGRAGGRVTEVSYKPDSTSHRTVAAEIFVYDTGVLLDELERLRREQHHEADDRDTGLGDFGDHLLPALVARGKAYAYALPGYWKDAGRPEAYLQAHRDLVRGRVDVFDHPSRPVRGQQVPGPPAYVAPEATTPGSMLSPGVRVLGDARVTASVLGPGVVVESGAVVEDSVLMAGARVEQGATVSTSVLDEQVVVGRGARVGELHASGPLSEEAVTLVGRDSRIGASAVLPRGTRMEPGSVA